MRNSLRTGFTLLETVVVIAIIGVLVGLLLSGIQRVRDAAQRSSCTSRVRQLAIAVHHYSDNHSHFPAGCSYPGPPSEPDLRVSAGLSWHTRLLPYVEQTELWNSAWTVAQDPLAAIDTEEDSHVATVVVKVYLCPSESRTHGMRNADYRWALTSYVGVAGTSSFFYDGIFHKQMRVSWAEITDGTSSTIMIGERPPGPNGYGSSWHASWGERTCATSQILAAGYRRSNVGNLTNCPGGSTALQPGRIDDDCSLGSFWSLHSGGANFAFCDGSVRFMKYSSASILPMLATRAGGEVISGFE